MTDEHNAIVPVWTLATGEVGIPAASLDQPMSASRLSELRGVLATLADQPIATLEAHRLPERVDSERVLLLPRA